MNHDDAARLWQNNADTWTQLTRAGYDRTRVVFNTPRFLEMLGEVAGLTGLDIGCGEGTNTREVAARGARMTGIDVAERFVAYARAYEADTPLGIDYRIASAHQLPFEDATFDFAVAFMSIMDIPQPEITFAEAHRVIKPGGLFQFSILHPCFVTRLRRWIRDENGNRLGVLCGDYWNHAPWESEWIFSAVPGSQRDKYKPFRTAYTMRTLSEWLNVMLDAGFTLDRLGEPRPTEREAQANPDMASDRIVPNFLHVRARRA